VHVIIVWTPTTLPMSGYSDRTDSERESLANNFIELALKFCQSIEKQGHWADFIEPLSGVPYINRVNANSVFVPTDMGSALDIDIVDVGCCQVMRHPQWKVRAFFSMMVSTAPLEMIIKGIQDIASTSVTEEVH
ncbi:hypothetical protein SAMD00019534_027510, partial [Acytostelium subglobosum LB1]|uniref:hypothetical protein n=1 Tax=Acytostelium subglobosum LB1 TaxID=1410327 RepID=UPI000644D732